MICLHYIKVIGHLQLFVIYSFVYSFVNTTSPRIAYPLFRVVNMQSTFWSTSVLNFSNTEVTSPQCDRTRLTKKFLFSVAVSHFCGLSSLFSQKS